MDLKDLIKSEISAQTGKDENPVTLTGPNAALFGKAAENCTYPSIITVTAGISL